ncbi:Endothelin-converting enzyme 1 [Orchesella cincta]|uniref:Endothelin-converting enzyme 1 n=1 Tax=Orchesella cincta TaxID=48709 RepID=A0A1D2MVL6_ORCCI|nr:Endothelin-converting enzyme 1 [Orchesella cincta]
MIIPLGILRYPMFVEEYPMYLNFANLGVVISHEITHGFDHQGRHYDKDGNFTTTWWPDDVVSAFKTQAICFADQYGKFEMPMVETNVDGNETLADNVCDNAALRISWLGYQLWMEDFGSEQKLPGVDYTISQVFYTLYAQIWCEVLSKEGILQYIGDSHAPGQFRTWGVAQNNKHFGEVFQCPVGSPMNPKDKCVLWS